MKKLLISILFISLFACGDSEKTKKIKIDISTIDTEIKIEENNLSFHKHKMDSMMMSKKESDAAVLQYIRTQIDISDRKLSELQEKKRELEFEIK